MKIKFEEIKKDDVVILSGSVPNSISKSIYADIIKLLPKDCKVILDTRGLHFVEGLKEGVFLTKLPCASPTSSMIILFQYYILFPNKTSPSPQGASNGISPIDFQVLVSAL